MTTDDRGACRMEGPMGDEVSADEAREMILGEIAAERVRQDARWGEQNHPNVDRVLTGRPTGCRVER